MQGLPVLLKRNLEHFCKMEKKFRYPIFLSSIILQITKSLIEKVNWKF